MSKRFAFAESEAWKNAVSNTYPLEIKEVPVQDQTILFYGNGKEFSNSPYITDGGIFNFKKPLSPKDFEGFSKPVLIKTRGILDIDPDLPHILVKDYFTYLLDLRGGEDDVWKNKIKSKTRNQIRKTEKLGLEIRVGKNLLQDFFAVISRAWRDLGTPTHSKKFYENIAAFVNDPSTFDSTFVVIYFRGEPVSAACLIFDDYSIHHPYAATLKEFNRFSINSALYWAIIKFGLRKKISYFDLGRSRIGQSTIPFKLSWGAKPVQLYYYYFKKATHKNEEDGIIINFFINLWKKLPLPVANFLGPKIIYKVLK